MNRTQTEINQLARLRPIAPIVPYVSVIIGMYLLQSAWAALLLYQAQMAIVLSFEGQWHHIGALTRCRKRRLIAVAGVMMFSGIALIGLAPLLGLTQSLAATASRFGLAGNHWLPFILCFSFTNGWMEEIYWRGYLGSTSRRLCWFDLWFAGYHALVLALFVDWWWALAAVVVLIGAAWSWRQSAHHSDGLLVNAVSHIGADLSILLAVWVVIG